MGFLENLFTKKYNEKNLINAYTSQKRDNKYDFLTLSFIECSNNNIAPDDWYRIFASAYDTLNKEKKLTQEEIWIFLELGIFLKLGEIDMVDFTIKQKMGLPKLKAVYSIFMKYTEEERKIISSILFSMWNQKVHILQEQNRLANNDDVYKIFNELTSDEQELWRRYNQELHHNVY